MIVVQSRWLSPGVAGVLPPPPRHHQASPPPQRLLLPWSLEPRELPVGHDQRAGVRRQVQPRLAGHLGQRNFVPDLGELQELRALGRLGELEAHPRLDGQLDIVQVDFPRRLARVLRIELAGGIGPGASGWGLAGGRGLSRGERGAQQGRAGDWEGDTKGAREGFMHLSVLQHL